MPSAGSRLVVESERSAADLIREHMLRPNPLLRFFAHEPREGWTLKGCIAGMGVGGFIPHWDERWTPLGYRNEVDSAVSNKEG